MKSKPKVAVKIFLVIVILSNFASKGQCRAGRISDHLKKSESGYREVTEFSSQPHSTNENSLKNDLLIDDQNFGTNTLMPKLQLDSEMKQQYHKAKKLSARHRPGEFLNVLLNGEGNLLPQKFASSDRALAVPNENVLISDPDYYLVDDMVPKGNKDWGNPSKHEVVINLKGLITADEEYEEDDDVGPSENQGQLDHGKKDETIAFIRAFEIHPKSSSGDPGGLGSPSAEGQPVGHANVNEIKTPETESRNLSRKRRQKASPVEGEDHQRRSYNYRRRKRKRRRRHRHFLKTAAEDDKETSKNADLLSTHQQERGLLRSESPAYVITSTKELKKDWCRTVPLKQKIVEANCKPRVIANNFCYGQCNSFFIPHTGSDGSGSAFQSCAFCKPHRPKWMTVTLQCPGQNPPTVEKQVLLIEFCKCTAEVLH